MRSDLEDNLKKAIELDVEENFWVPKEQDFVFVKL